MRPYRPRAAAAVAALLLALPNGVGAQLIGEGPNTSSNFFPFGGAAVGNVAGPGTVYQQIYAASSFAGPTTFSTVRFFRVPTSVGEYRPATYELYLSTSARSVTGPGGLSTADFDGNRGADNVLFATRTLTAGPTDLFLDFVGAFAYDPSAGNLLVDIRVVGAGPNPVNRVNFRTRNGNADGLFSRAHNFSTATTGLENWGLITEFVIAPAQVVPEPGTVLLVGAGLALGGAWARRRRV